VFTIGMKEFGVAMAVALAFFPAKTALPATLYGVIMLVTTPLLVKWLRGDDPQGRSAAPRPSAGPL
jgi:predicted Na+-dependent transporter